MNQEKILIVEDHVKMADSIKKGLDESGYSTDVAYDGFIGQRFASSNKYDLIILDVNLPQVNGYEVCTSIRKKDPDIPIIFLTAMGTTDDKLMGFDRGGDDYIVKPFEFSELLARIKALLKRRQQVPKEENITVGDLTIDLNSKMATRGTKKIDLTAKEFALLEYMMRNKGKVISKADIAEKIWNISFDTGTNVIEVYVNFLRKKIDRDFDKKLIQTFIGMGYMLRDPDTDAN